MQQSFRFTADGYAAAKIYLLSTNQYYLLDKELSTDGYTLITLANSLINNQPTKPQP